MSENRCPLCGRELIDGPSVDEHHLVPRSRKKNNDTVTLHRICHQKIHSLFTETEIAKFYYTIDLLLGHEEIQKFVKWVQKKDPTFYDSSRDHKERKRKRKNR